MVPAGGCKPAAGAWRRWRFTGESGDRCRRVASAAALLPEPAACLRVASRPFEAVFSTPLSKDSKLYRAQAAQLWSRNTVVSTRMEAMVLKPSYGEKNDLMSKPRRENSSTNHWIRKGITQDPSKDVGIKTTYALAAQASRGD